MHGGNVSEFLQEHNAEAEIVFRNRMIRFAYELITKSQENEKTRKLCQKILYEGDTEIEKELAKLCISKNYELKENETSSKRVVRSKIVRRSIIQELSGGDDVIVEDVQNRSSSILNAPCVRPKGISNARLKGHLEKRKSKTSKLPKPSYSFNNDASSQYLCTSLPKCNTIFPYGLLVYEDFSVCVASFSCYFWNLGVNFA
ncbi:hypothetical protein V6N13_041578 [Hibiscus sabdariffa]